jgi:hypothetical protein
MGDVHICEKIKGQRCLFREVSLNSDFQSVRLMLYAYSYSHTDTHAHTFSSFWNRIWAE